jgi:photosystem II stability/assembly factor-like uncharacterized protein
MQALSVRIGAAAAALALLFTAAANGAGFTDPTATPARRVTNVQLRPMLAVTETGGSIVAVGLRGIAAASSSDGRVWDQTNTPVESDLVAVQFPTARQGWAVGHDGVVLSSGDGGRTWRKVLDGRQAAQSVVDAYEARSTVDPVARFYTAEARRTLSSQPDTPFLDVLFLDEREGFVVGNFGTILHTADAGQTWRPWMDRVKNDEALHLTAIRRIGEDVFVCGERGQVWRLDKAGARFVSVAAPYKGTFFGLTGRGDVVLAFGLRGTAYRSENKGESWIKLDTNVESGLVAGASLADGRVLLLGQGGELVSVSSDGRTLQLFQLPGRLHPTSILAMSADVFIVATLEGMRRLGTADLLQPTRRPAQ